MSVLTKYPARAFIPARSQEFAFDGSISDLNAKLTNKAIPNGAREGDKVRVVFHNGDSVVYEIVKWREHTQDRYVVRRLYGQTLNGDITHG